MDVKMSTLFVSKKTNSVIALEHVVMARWSGTLNRWLMVFFSQAPHLELPEDEGNDFLAALLAYHQSF